MQAKDDPAAIYAIERPSPQLMTYYVLKCLVTGPLFPIVVIPHYFKYHTLRYKFSNEGISMRWGILFRREVILNYSRIQDIHLSSNVIERWLDLAKVEIQTASGSASAEMTIEGLTQFEAVRDFVYAKMRGIKESAGKRPAALASPAVESGGADGELAQTLEAVAGELRAIRLALEQPPHHANRLQP